MKRLLLIGMLVSLAGCDLDKSYPNDALAIKKCQEAGGERLSKRFVMGYIYVCYDKAGNVAIKELRSIPFYDDSIAINE